MISLYGQARSTYLADRLAKQRKAQTTALMSKYRDPLLRSAIDRQSRLFNIHQNASSLVSDLYLHLTKRGRKERALFVHPPFLS
jgi:hypothetical protein